VVPLFDAVVRVESLTQRRGIWSQHTRALGYHVVKTRSLYLTWAWIGTGSWRTDR